MKLRSLFLTAINTAADAGLDALNAATGFFQSLNLTEGEKKQRYRFADYGEYPVTLADGRTVTQVFDREAADAVASNFRKYAGLDIFFKGVPMFEGHADDANWMRANPGHKASAVARIKAVHPADDGMDVETVFNSDGLALVSGEAPKYSAHSPRWRMQPIPGRDGCYRPVLLLSDALTNSPNIPGSVMALNSGDPCQDLSSGAADAAPGEPETQTNDTNDMKLTVAALAALGFAPDAALSADEISTAVCKLAGDKATADGAVTSANSKIIDLDAHLKAARGQATDTVIAAAIADGRITEADKPKWVDALNTSFESESAKLAKLMPVLNTASRLPDLATRRAEGAPVVAGIDAINTAVREYAAEKKIDITDADGWTRAFEGARAAKPEIFARK